MTDSIKNVTIIGIGVQGSMIAFRNAIYGKNVVCFARHESSVENCKKKIDGWFESYIVKGKMNEEEAAEAKARISYVPSLEEACQTPDLIIEAIPEILERKQELFKRMDELCPQYTWFSSNTSSLLMSEIVKDLPLERKQKTYQVDHDDPVVNGYLEMMFNEYTSEEAKAAAKAHYATLDFKPIVIEKENKGYAINRVWRAIKRECLHLWADGFVSPEDFDRGWKIVWTNEMGPFEYMDIIGLDTIYDIEMSYYNASKEERDFPPQQLKDMVDAGKLGVKSGSGFYEYKK